MIIFNGIRLADIGWTVQALNRPASPTLSTDSYSTANITGSVFRSRTIGEREITVTLHHTAKTLETLQDKIRELINVLCVSEPRPLAFDDIPGFHFKAIVTGQVGASQTRSYGQVTVIFLCNDPMLYANTAQEYPITNNGVCRWLKSAYQDWTLAITVKASMTKISVGIGDTKVVLNGNFQANDIIKVDTDECIKLNNEYAPHLLSFDSRIHQLTIGDNACTVEGNVTATLSVLEKRLY